MEHSLTINSQYLQCPVTLEKYSDVNFPVTLPCGHTLSIQAFSRIRQIDNTCPSCKEPFSLTFHPKKNVLLLNLVSEIQEKRNISCQNHPEEKAVVLCIEEKAFFCVECLIKDKHPEEKKIILKDLQKYFQGRKQTLIEDFEKQKDHIIDEDEVKKVTTAIIKNLEPSIEKLVKNELQDERTEDQGLENIVKKIDWIINKNLITESVHVLNEIEDYTLNIANSQESSNGEGENIRRITKKILHCLDKAFQIESERRDRSEINLALKKDVQSLIQIHHKKKIKKLLIEFSKNFQQIERLCDVLPDFPFLTSLELNFDSCQKINDLAIKDIGGCLKNMTSLTTINLTFSKCSISDTGLIDLSFEIKNLAQLQSLELDFTDCKLANPGFKRFAKCLKAFSGLSNLKLSIFNNKSLESVGIVTLSSSLKKLIHLNNLELNLGKTNINSQGIIEIIQGIQELRFLSKLKLGLAECEMINEEGFVELIAGLGLFVALEYLEINFEKCQAVNDKVIVYFGGMRYVTALRTLKLNLYDCLSVTSDSIKALNQYLMSLEVLENLELLFGTGFDHSPPLKEEFLTDLSLSIGQLKTLKDLKLIFVSLQTAGPLVNSLGPCLSKLKLLESFKLQFKDCKFITDAEVVEIAKPLGELKNLKVLKLNFSSCKSMSDRGLQELSLYLKNLESLNDLSLEFFDCQLISDVAVIEVAKQVGNLKSINKLKLDLRKSKSFRDAGMFELCNCIKKFPKMVELCLCFGEAISDTGIKELSRTLKELNDLQKLSLKFENCHSITDNALSSLSTGLNNLGKIEQLELSFKNCNAIKDEGVQKIIQRIGSSMKELLRKLYIKFESCKSVGNQVNIPLNQLMLNFK